MKWDLKTPCKNCPFMDTKYGIKFSCRERASEIEEQAYRNGFPCHLSAVDTSDEDEESGGFVFGPETQHCAGAILVFLKDGYDGNVPFENLSDKEQDRIRSRLNWNAPTYNSVEEFLNASTRRPGGRKRKARSARP
jgi:hypothetical protein